MACGTVSWSYRARWPVSCTEVEGDQGPSHAGLVHGDKFVLNSLCENSHGRDLSGIVNDTLAPVWRMIWRGQKWKNRDQYGSYFRIAGKLWKWLGPQ